MPYGSDRLLKKGVALGLTVSAPNRDKLMVRQAHHEIQALKSLHLILSLSKDEPVEG
jgi:hypothetical protein